MSIQPLPYRVLMVEDNEELGETFRFGLKQIGINADLAPTGEEAIEYIHQVQPDLVLLDLNLPGMSGWDVLDNIRQRYGEPSVPIIVASAFSDDTNRIVGRLHYVRRYLVKPFTFDQLFKAVEDVLELYKVSV